MYDKAETQAKTTVFAYTSKSKPFNVSLSKRISKTQRQLEFRDNSKTVAVQSATKFWCVPVLSVWWKSVSKRIQFYKWKKYSSVEKRLVRSGIKINDAFHSVANNDELDPLVEILVGATIQIGLYNILKSLNAVPVHVFGISYGIFSSAYAEGILTLEETITLLYCQAKYVTDNEKQGNGNTQVNNHRS